MNGIRRINLIKAVTLLGCVCETRGFNIAPYTDYSEKFSYCLHLYRRIPGQYKYKSYLVRYALCTLRYW